MAHPVKIKIEAIGMLMAGESVANVARKLSLPKQTVSRWKSLALAFAGASLQHDPEYETEKGRG